MIEDLTIQEKNYKEWLRKSKIDYFEPFMTLWVGFNSWYNNTGEKRDRLRIEEIKIDRNTDNKIYYRFEKLIKDSDKESLQFRTDLEGLHYALANADLQYPYKIKLKYDEERFNVLNFKFFLIDYKKRKNQNTGYANILTDPPPDDKPKIESIEEQPFIKLDKVHLINDLDMIFSGLIEIIYLIRNQLFHGRLQPYNQYQSEVVKYCYELLFNLTDWE